MWIQSINSRFNAFLSSVEGERIAKFSRLWQEWIDGSSANRLYYSTNCNTIQIWSWCSRYLSSVGDIRGFVRGKKKWSEKMSTERFKNVTSFVINLVNNKTVILLNLAEYRLLIYWGYEGTSQKFERDLCEENYLWTFFFSIIYRKKIWLISLHQCQLLP